MTLKIPATMMLQEFLVWDAPPGFRWQLVDGEPQAMARSNRTHGRIQARLSNLIDTHLVALGGPSTVITEPGVVPPVRFDWNFRIPDLAVTCTGYEREESMLTDPVLVAEVLSPTNQAETWANVWAYTTIPSVEEILVVYSTGVLELSSIEFSVDLAEIYQGTRLAA